MTIDYRAPATLSSVRHISPSPQQQQTHFIPSCTNPRRNPAEAIHVTRCEQPAKQRTRPTPMHSDLQKQQRSVRGHCIETAKGSIEDVQQADGSAQPRESSVFQHGKHEPRRRISAQHKEHSKQRREKLIEHKARKPIASPITLSMKNAALRSHFGSRRGGAITAARASVPCTCGSGLERGSCVLEDLCAFHASCSCWWFANDCPKG